MNDENDFFFPQGIGVVIVNGERDMLFAGWEVRIVKNCDRGLAEMWRDFQARGHSFFTIRTDPKPAKNIFIFFSSGKLA